MIVSYRDAADAEQACADLLASVQLETVHLQDTEAEWTEGDLPSPAPATKPTTARHLEYSVAIESLGFDGLRDPRTIAVRGDLVVVFQYRLRGQTRRADARNAARLAADVLRAFSRGPIPGLTVVPSTVYRPGRAVGEWLPVELRFTVAFDLSLE